MQEASPYAFQPGVHAPSGYRVHEAGHQAPSKEKPPYGYLARYITDLLGTIYTGSSRWAAAPSRSPHQSTQIVERGSTKASGLSNEAADPDHPVFQDESLRKDLSCTIPYLLHGDEGRGRMKQPILVIAFQGVLSHLGINRLNESGYL